MIHTDNKGVALIGTGHEHFQHGWGWVEGSIHVAAGRPLAPVSEAEADPVPRLGQPPPAWAGDPGGESNLA